MGRASELDLPERENSTGVTADSCKVPVLKPTEFVVVKLQEAVSLPDENDRHSWAAYFQELVPDFDKWASVWIRSCFDLSTDRMLGLLRRASRRDRSYEWTEEEGPKLFRYFVFGCPDESVAAELNDICRRMKDQFGYVYIESGSTLASDEAYASPCGEAHLYEAPYGISALYAHRFPGGDGLGIRLADIEGGWQVGISEELQELVVTFAPGKSVDRYAWHGNAVLSIIAAAADDRGVNGIAPGVSSIRAFSIYRDTEHHSIRRIADAILAAVQELRFGDVLLLEIESTPSVGKRPIEGEAAVFEAIQLAAAMGIVVIEPAGNGGYDLDHPSESEELWQVSDSGAILVGASQRQLPYPRHPDSNFGRRVNCFAWGESIRSIGNLAMLSPRARRRYLECNCPGLDRWMADELLSDLSVLREQLEVRNFYLVDPYRCFSHTSAASAILAGVALCVQGLALANLRFRMSPWQMRLILSDPRNGTHSANPAVDKIGVMPDLKAIINEVFCLPADVYLRDRVGDVGDRPRTRTAESPDIICFPESFRDANRRLGEGSGRENDDFTYNRFAPRSGSYFYIRLRNRGGESCHAQVDLFRAPLAPCPLPSSWKFIGSTDLQVRPGDLLTVSRAIRWTEDQTTQEAVADPGPFAWIAMAYTDNDPMPSQEELADLPGDDFIDFWRRSNNVACRNLLVVPFSGGSALATQFSDYLRLPFEVHRIPVSGLKGRLEILSQIPRGASVWLEMPEDWADLRGISRIPEIQDSPSGSIFVPVNPTGRSYFREEHLENHNTAVWRLRLIVKVPQTLRNVPCRIAVRQMLGQEEIGRVTWRIVPEEFGLKKL